MSTEGLERFQEDQQERSKPASPKIIILLGLPAFILVAIEFIGISITDRELRPLYPHNALLNLVGAVGLALSCIASPAAIVAANKLVSIWRHRLRNFLLVFVVSALLLSLFGCGWTFSGHPTWYQGY